MRFSDFRRMCGQWWSTTIMQTRLSRVGEGISTLDTVTMSDGDGVNPGAEIDLTRLEQFGDVVIPPNDLNVAILRKSDGGYDIPLGQPSTRPTDGKQGDRGLYCSQVGARVQLHGAKRPNPGRLQLDSATGSTVPADVVVNGGGAKVSRVGDHGNGGRIHMTAVTAMGVTTATILYTEPGSVIDTVVGVLVFTGTGTAGSATLSTELTEGAEHFKA